MEFHKHMEHWNALLCSTKCISSTQQRLLDRRVIATALLPAQGVTRSMTEYLVTVRESRHTTRSKHTCSHLYVHKGQIPVARFLPLCYTHKSLSKEVTRVTGGWDGWMCMYVCAFPSVRGEEMVK